MCRFFRGYGFIIQVVPHHVKHVFAFFLNIFCAFCKALIIRGCIFMFLLAPCPAVCGGGGGAGADCAVPGGDCVRAGVLRR